MPDSLAELSYETRRKELNFTARNGEWLRPFAELRKSLNDRDVLEVQAEILAAEAVAQAVRDTMPEGERQVP